MGHNIESLLACFEDLPTAIISDVMERLPGTYSLRPIHGRGRLLGRALTVRVAAGDNLYIHHALRVAQPGDVLVVDGGGAIDRALIGEIMLAIARSKGVHGYVIDGAIRDSEAFAEQAFPCFARGVTHRGPYKNGPGAIGVPICIDGTVVQPGDIVVGDVDGVMFIPVAEAEAVLQRAQAKVDQEQVVMAQIAGGTYDDSWVLGSR